MKQTAVDWLFNRLWETPKDKLTWYAILADAKDMEKDQIKQAYLDSSRETCLSYGENPPHDDPKFAELYYKKNYEENEKGN
jgi:hypothetical protein